MNDDMTRKRPALKKTVGGRAAGREIGIKVSSAEEDPSKSVERVLALSDAEFEKWLDTAIAAGLASR